MTLRVVQWTTGNVGRQSVTAIAENPGLELVGCYAWSPDKVGRDVGELCGLDPLGVTATDDVDALLALRPDCVVYNPMWPSIDELVRILEAGVNVVSTAAFINGRRLGPDRKRLVEACERGGSSLFGTGINPGFAELLSIVVAGICDRIDKVTVSEAAHTAGYDSPATEIPAGFGRPIDDPDLQAMTAEGTAVFSEAVAMVADALGVELDDVVCEAEYAKTTTDLDLGSWQIAAGCVAGVAASWQGRVGDRTVVELNVRWKKAADPRARLADRGRVRHRGAGTSDRADEGAVPSSAGLPGQDARGLHGAGPHHDGDARHQRHPGRGGRPAGYRELPRSPAAPATRARPSLTAPDAGTPLSHLASSTSPTCAARWPAACSPTSGRTSSRSSRRAATPIACGRRSRATSRRRTARSRSSIATRTSAARRSTSRDRRGPTRGSTSSATAPTS